MILSKEDAKTLERVVEIIKEIDFSQFVSDEKDGNLNPTINIGTITFPNVTNENDIINAIKNLPHTAKNIIK